METISVTADPQTPMSLEELYGQHFEPMVILAGLLVHDRSVAEDLAQEAFIRFAQRAPRMSPSDQPRYLRRVLINLTRSHLRRRAVIERYASRARETSDDVTSAAGMSRADQGRVAVAVRSLPRRQRECVVLRYYAELSDQEIATTLGMSASSAKTSLRRARVALARVLGERDDD